MYKIYTTKYINIISFLCSIIIFALVYIIGKQVMIFDYISSILDVGKQDIINVEFNNNVNQNQAQNVVTNNEIQSQWFLEIPRIFLEANISEGTTKEVMDVDIGHFEESSKTTGNVCLAAHNRGYPVNYFENLKMLREGDIIHYTYHEFTKEYVITENTIIQDTDWTYLEQTEDNVITLITCVENEPEYRRCVRAIERL